MLKELLTRDLANDEENSYRQFYLKPDLNLAKKGILLFTIPLAAFTVNDFLLLNLSPTFLWVTALRLSLLIFSILITLKIGEIPNYRLYDKTITVTTLVIMLGCGIINMTRPQNFVAQVVMSSISILILYLVIPNRFLNQILLATTLVAGETLIIIFFVQPSSLPTIFTLFLSMVFVNIVGVLTAWQLQTYRKRTYKEFTKYKEMQKTLEDHSRNLEAIVEDRTKRLKDKERLAAIGATAGMVGHDIRNPLQAITSDIYLINSELANIPENQAKEGIKESLESIQSNIEYVNKIVQDLQDYTRPLGPTMENIELEKLFAEIMAKAAFPEDIYASFEVEQKAKRIVGDQALLKRILSNLINNAAQAMPNGGKLTLYAYHEANDTVITVEDTGLGIPEDVKPKLFTPLFTTKSKGQGFGLAVVKRMTEALEGTVTFESESGKGTVFMVRLPTNGKNVAPLNSAVLTSATKKIETIVVFSE